MACTPVGCVLLAKDTLGDLSGVEAVVVGRSNIVGKPVAQLLLAENCTVTICHSRTRDLAGVVPPRRSAHCRRRPAEMVKGDWIKPGACVIDVGINRIEQATARPAWSAMSICERAQLPARSPRSPAASAR